MVRCVSCSFLALQHINLQGLGPVQANLCLHFQLISIWGFRSLNTWLGYKSECTEYWKNKITLYFPAILSPISQIMRTWRSFENSKFQSLYELIKRFANHMSPYKQCEILSFQSRAKYVVFEISDTKPLESLVLSFFFPIFRTFCLAGWVLGQWITVHSQMQTNDVTKDSPIVLRTVGN